MVELILGTATFGTGYGVANQGKILDDKSIREIVETAQELGIRNFDTAPSYGEAESKLGKFLNDGLSSKVSSKISKENSASADLMLASVKNTLERTKVSKLENLYLHDPEALSGPAASETIAGLEEIVSLDLVERVGVSVYSLDSLLRAKQLFPQLSVFQVPENICDRRLFKSAELMNLANEGNHFIVRSIFMQGLLLMPLDEIPSGLNGARDALSGLKAFAKSNNNSVLDLCLGYGQIIPWASGLIIGSACAQQLRQIIESRAQLPEEWESKIKRLPDSILDPRKW